MAAADGAAAAAAAAAPGGGGAALWPAAAAAAWPAAAAAPGDGDDDGDAGPLTFEQQTNILKAERKAARDAIKVKTKALKAIQRKKSVCKKAAKSLTVQDLSMLLAEKAAEAVAG